MIANIQRFAFDLLLAYQPSQITTFRGYSWNPFMSFLEAELEPGRTIKVEIGHEGTKRMTFKPTLLSIEPNRELRWLGKLLVRGVFDGEHVFQLEPTEDGGTRFVHFEEFKGLLVGLLKRKLERDVRPGFEAMNAALKARAESIHRVATAPPR